jgi:prevent-host-death family protein
VVPGGIRRVQPPLPARVKDHHPPHFHAQYGEFEVEVAIEGGPCLGRTRRRRWCAGVPLSGCYDDPMRTVSALDVRKHFGEIVDQAAGGERIVIERAGQPIAAIVPLADLELVDPERRRAARLAVIDAIERRARRQPFETNVDYERLMRDQRRAREAQIDANVRRATRS